MLENFGSGFKLQKCARDTLQSIQEDEQLPGRLPRSQVYFLYTAPQLMCFSPLAIWSKQSVVLIGGTLDQEPEAPITGSAWA